MAVERAVVGRALVRSSAHRQQCRDSSSAAAMCVGVGGGGGCAEAVAWLLPHVSVLVEAVAVPK